VTDDIRTEFPTALSSREHDVLDVPERAQRMEADTVAAIAAAVVGVVCVLAAAVGVIALYVAPLGAGAVVLSSVVAGAVATTLLAGGVWAWFTDRRGRGV
jgi:CBS-domain-containing membrane protein